MADTATAALLVAAVIAAGLLAGNIFELLAAHLARRDDLNQTCPGQSTMGDASDGSPADGTSSRSGGVDAAAPVASRRLDPARGDRN